MGGYPDNGNREIAALHERVDGHDDDIERLDGEVKRLRDWRHGRAQEDQAARGAFAMIRRHDERIGKLEAWQNRAIGMALMASVISGIVVAIAGHFWK